jgi:DtxR family Mn-dependent transcriptional regulator
MMVASESREEYLEAVFKLSATQPGATITRLAQELDVAPASASEMVSRLTKAGSLTRDERGRITLSEMGRLEAVRLVRRHRLSERLLADYLDLPWDLVHEEACKFEHILSDAVEASLAERLGHPLTCPHGRAIPDETGTVPEEASLSLADLGPGDRCTISYVSEERPELLRYLASLGLSPGAKVIVEEVAPFGGPLMILVDGVRHPLAREVARVLFVT